MEFPLMLHKLGTTFDWNGVICDYVIVEDRDEADIAMSDGYGIGCPDQSADAPRQTRAIKKKDAE